MSRRVTWWAELTGASDGALIDGLREQLDVALEAARIAGGLARGELGPEEARAAAARTEQTGDGARDEVFGMLSTLLTTPMDREDLYRLSRGLEDVVNNLRDFVREAYLLGVANDPLIVPLTDAIVSALEGLATPLRAIVDDLPGAGRGVRTLHREINEVRRTYQQGLAELYEGELTMDTLKRRDLLRRLDVVGLKLGEAVAAISDGAMKRGR
jgi:uncharacterized protein